MSDLTQYKELLARHDYAVIDLAARQADTWNEELPLKPLVPFSLRQNATLFPSCVALKTLNEQQIELLCQDMKAAEKDEYRSVISILASCPEQVNEDSFIAHFMNHLLMQSPKGRFVLRFWDSRVFPHLRRIIAKEQFYGLYAGVVREWTIFFQGKWISQPAPEVESIRVDWQVSDEEYAQINRVLLINEAVTEWKATQEKRFADLFEFDLVSAHLDNLLKTAEEEYQLSEDDQKEFVLHALLYGLAFYKHALIQELLQNRNTNSWSYSANAASKLDEAQWKEIATTAPIVYLTDD